MEVKVAQLEAEQTLAAEYVHIELQGMREARSAAADAVRGGLAIPPGHTGPLAGCAPRRARRANTTAAPGCMFAPEYPIIA